MDFHLDRSEATGKDDISTNQGQAETAEHQRQANEKTIDEQMASGTVAIDGLDHANVASVDANTQLEHGKIVHSRLFWFEFES